MEFQDFQIGSIGDLMTEENFGWVNVSIWFTDQETNAHPSIELKVPIKYDRGSTLDEVRESAIEKARQVLVVANGLLAAHDLAGLQRLHDEFEAERAGAADRLP